MDLATALRNRKFHEILAQEASSMAPTPSWGAALARALQGGVAGLIEGSDNVAEGNKFDRFYPDQQQQSAAQPASLGAALASPQDKTTLVGGNPDYGKAIASIESGGAYDKLGPVTKTGDRAYGKYQVMGANVGPWSKEILGQEMTPQQFTASPEAQDAVFKGRFGQYAQKYGPEGAARAWFAGEGGMNDPNRKDQLGTTVARYGQRFAQAAGLPQTQDQAVLPPNAAPTQGFSVPGQQQTAQAQPPRAAPQIPPQVRAVARQIAIEQGQAAAAAFLAPYLKPVDRMDTVMVNGRPVQRSSTTGEEKASPRLPDYDIKQRDDGAIVMVNKNDPTDMRIVKPPGAAADLAGFAGEKSRATESGQVLGKGDAAVPGGLENAKFIHDTISKIENHPGLKWGTGLSGKILGNIPGTDPYDFQAAVGQLKGRAFLDAFEALRGGGQISNVEGDKATAAKARMDTAQSEKAFREALRDYTDVVKSAVNRVMLQSRTSSDQAEAMTKNLGPPQSKNNDPLGLRR